MPKGQPKRIVVTLPNSTDRTKAPSVRKGDEMSEAEAGNLQAGVTDEDDTEDVPVEPLEGEQGPELITDKPEEETKEEPEKKEPDTSQWDQERQERDQRYATERKELTSQIEALQEQAASSGEALQELRATKEAAEKPKDEGSALDADADIDDIVKALNETKAFGQEASQEIASLRKELADRDAKQAERDEKSAAVNAKAAYESTVRSLEEQFSDEPLGIDGAKYSAEAQKRAQQFFTDKGYTKEDPPSDVASDLALKDFFREVRDEDPTYQPKPRAKLTVTLDTGTGGGKTSTSRRPMNHEDFKAHRRKQGRPVD
ncbi:hypothetical protein LCGC14_0298450 [marine sediment metagenome]|uniref:Uncharacterized protein n=1 Tax=marine sediment metagenome TaxID=412755 RepID=A0A0F9TRB6_9ZZZZ